MTNYRDGVVRNGSSIGSGSSIGNIKDGVVRTVTWINKND